MPKKIKILHIQQTIGSGGVERRRLSLARYLDKSLFDQRFVCTETVGNIADEIRNEGWEVIPIGMLRSPWDWSKHRKVQQIIDEYQPDIVHGAVFEGVTMAAFNGWLKNVPVIIIEETSDPQNRSWKATLLLKVFSLVSDKAIAIAPNVADYLVNTAKISKRKVVTITNGVKIPREVTEEEVVQVRNRYGMTSNDFVVGSVGRLFNDHKRFTDIIEALSLIPNQNVKLLIVGGGKDEEMIRTKISELSLDSRVIMTGYQEDIASLYKVMDVFCIASQREGFGLVAAEAMLNKLPVIASKVGGLQDIVIDNITGFLIPPFSPRDIADKIEILCNQDNILLVMGEEGYKRAVEKYTEKRYVDEVGEFYKMVRAAKKLV